MADASVKAVRAVLATVPSDAHAEVCTELVRYMVRLDPALFEKNESDTLLRVIATLNPANPMIAGHQYEAADIDTCRRSKRKLLVPHREAPAPPAPNNPPLSPQSAGPASAHTDGAEKKQLHPKKSLNVPVRPAPSPDTDADNQPDDTPVDFAKLKQWLKRHRLHKYASNFSSLTYTRIIQLSENDLEGLGITAQGARTKMLKSIADLKALNEQRERDILQIRKNTEAGMYAAAIQGMLEVLHLPNSSGTAVQDGPASTGFDLASKTIALVQDVVTRLLLVRIAPNQLTPQITADVAQSLLAFLEQVIRLEFFSVDQRSQLFTWKAEAEAVLNPHRQKPTRPASSGVVLDARSKGFEPTWRSVDPPTSTQHTKLNGSSSSSNVEHVGVGVESTWSTAAGAVPGAIAAAAVGVPGSSYTSVARRAVKARDTNAPRAARPYSTGSLFYTGATTPDSVSLISMSSLGSGDLFDPIWGQPGGGSGSNSNSNSNSNSRNGSGVIFTEEELQTPMGGTIGSTPSKSETLLNNRLSSEFSESWHERERSATAAPIPSFWSGVDEQHIEGLTLSMTAMLDDEDRHSKA